MAQSGGLQFWLWIQMASISFDLINWNEGAA